MKKFVPGKPPLGGNSHSENYHPSNCTQENVPPENWHPEISHLEYPTHLINCLPSLNVSFWQSFTNVKHFWNIELKNSLLSNVNDHGSNNEKNLENSGENI